MATKLMLFFKTLTAIILFNVVNLSKAAVILQYHHVSEQTAFATSISPTQFEAHLQFIKAQGFTVIALPELVDALRQHKTLPDKTVVITFDDAYVDLLTVAKPLLDRFKYPFTVFINPAIVDQAPANYLTWSQLQAMAEDGVVIANHGFEHHSMIRMPTDMTTSAWLERQRQLLEKSEALIAEKVGQNWRFLAYPYGEFMPDLARQITELGFIGFSQQSGAVGHDTDLSAMPRFPVSQPYDQLAALRDKLYALAFDQLVDLHPQTIISPNQPLQARFQVMVKDFNPAALRCYITGVGQQIVEWHGQTEFSIALTPDLPSGRVRANCTAPSISQPGRYYWYSKPWFILRDDGSWYHL